MTAGREPLDLSRALVGEDSNTSAEMRESARQLKNSVRELRKEHLRCRLAKTRSFGWRKVAVSRRHPDGVGLTAAGKIAAEQYWSSEEGKRWIALHERLIGYEQRTRDLLGQIEQENWFEQWLHRDEYTARIETLKAQLLKSARELEQYCPKLKDHADRVSRSKVAWDVPLEAPDYHWDRFELPIVNDVKWIILGVLGVVVVGFVRSKT